MSARKTDSAPNAAKKTAAAPNAAAKPRKPAAGKKKADVLQMQSPASIPHEQVALLAHRFWNERGRDHGRHEEDWFRAEELLRGKAS
jgi:hypothetical protein